MESIRRVEPRSAIAVAAAAVLYAGLAAVSWDHAAVGAAGPRDRSESVLGAAPPAGDSGGSAPAANADGDDGSGPSAAGRRGGRADQPIDADRHTGSPDESRRPGGAASPSPNDPDRPEPLQIGFEAVQDSSAAYAAIGAEGLGPRQERDYILAITEWVNENGGIGGVPIAPVIREVDVTVGTFAAQAQATCAYFTEDHDVRFAVGRINDRDDLLPCLAKRGVPLVAQNRYLWDEPVFAANPGLLYLPGGLSGSRHDLWVEGLQRAGFLSGGRHGISRFDTAPYERTSREVVQPALARLGTDVVMEVVVRQPESVAAFSNMNSELANAVLRLRQARVDHLMVLDEGTIVFFFVQQAESQQYRPVYGFHSQNIPEVTAANAPAEQIRNVVGAGWVPTLDVGFDADPGPTPGFARCDRILRDAGIQAADRFAQSVGMRYCDSTLFLKAALERGGELSPSGLQRGVEALDRDHRSALTFSASFGPGRYDGADAVRAFAWDLDCGCFRYTE